jgi:predicted Rossmann-fold nucleotide-binding protein
MELGPVVRIIAAVHESADGTNRSLSSIRAAGGVGARADLLGDSPDLFIALRGGIGTLEELSGVDTAKTRSRHLDQAGSAALVLPISARHCPGETP